MRTQAAETVHEFWRARGWLICTHANYGRTWLTARDTKAHLRMSWYTSPIPAPLVLLIAVNPSPRQ